jgi:hypothetical protein
MFPRATRFISSVLAPTVPTALFNQLVKLAVPSILNFHHQFNFTQYSLSPTLNLITPITYLIRSLNPLLLLSCLEKMVIMNNTNLLKSLTQGFAQASFSIAIDRLVMANKTPTYGTPLSILPMLVISSRTSISVIPTSLNPMISLPSMQPIHQNKIKALLLALECKMEAIFKLHHC